MATVYGIVTTSSWTTGVPGVMITALSSRKSVRVTSDSAGRFDPGRYSFQGSKDGKQFKPGS
jgi:hypothetical protein